MNYHSRFEMLAKFTVLWLAWAGCSYSQLPEIHRIKLVHVDSEAINMIGYHHKTKTLQVQFHSGDTYRYAKVPLEVYNGLLNAESKGRYFQEHIRGHYHYWKVDTK